jgi:hypothetical protein
MSNDKQDIAEFFKENFFKKQILFLTQISVSEKGDENPNSEYK